MKESCVLVVFVLVLICVVPCSASAQPSFTRVRPLDALAEMAFARGLSGSALFRQLVTELNASDAIVHVVTAVSLPGAAVGTTRLSFARDQDRYIRIVLDGQIPSEDRVAILGHELQHACEIVRSRAHDTGSVRALYETIGQPVPGVRNAYETNAAIHAGAQVWFELHHQSSRTTHARQD